MIDWIQLVAALLASDADDVRIITAREDRAVLRVDGDAGPLVVKVSSKAGAFDEEAAAIATLQSLHFPVSTVRVLQAGPPALLAATWTDGEPLTAAATPQTLAEVGRMLRRIHRRQTSPPYSSHPSILAWIEHWFSLVLPWWRSVEPRISGADAATAWLERCRPVLARQSGCLMLFDGRPEHWRVSADGTVRLIDVADLQPGHFAMDLAVLELDIQGVLPGILRGYAPDTAEQQIIATLVPLFVLLRALSGAEWLGSVVGDTAGQQHYLRIAHDVLERNRPQWS